MKSISFSCALFAFLFCFAPLHCNEEIQLNQGVSQSNSDNDALQEIDLPDGYVLENICDDPSPSSLLLRLPLPLPMNGPLVNKDVQEESSAALEEGPKTTVAGCVNVISGVFFDSQTDFIVPGAHPLMVNLKAIS